MLIWTHWGIAIPFLGYLGAIAGNYSALAIGLRLNTVAPWLMAVGQVIGAMAASLLLFMFCDWRSTRGGEKRRRALVEEKTGQRVEFDDPGDTFFWIHGRHWIWLALVIGAAAAAVTIWRQIPLHEI